MTWVIKDDQFPEHPKVWALSDAAYRLHDAAIHYCNRHETDGRLPVDKARALVPRFKKSALDELVGRSMWTVTDTEYLIHDFLDWNPSHAEREAKREAQRKGGKKGAQRRWGR